jgi:hypothetical protein
MASLRAKQSSPKQLKFNWPDLSEDQHTMVFDPHQILWIATGTKTGKTVAGAVWIGQGIALGERCAWIGPYHKRTRTGFDHIAQAYAGAASQGLATIHSGNEMRIVVPGTHGVLECFSGDSPQSIYGEAFDRVFVDEATRMGSAVLPAVLSTVTATNGKARFAFNLDQGRRHWAVQGFLNARAGGDPDHGFVFLPTSRSPYVDKKTIELMRRSLPDRVFRALYLGEIQEDGAGVFRNIESCHEGVLGSPEDGHTYVVGLDLARKSDYSVAVVMDVRTRHVVGFERMHGEPWMLQCDRIASLAKVWNDALVVPDATGVGDVVIAALNERNVRMAPVVITSGRDLTQTGVPKGMLIQQLMVAIERRTFTWPACLEVLNEELKSFEYDTTNAGAVVYAACDGANDDCVVALALCVWGARNAYVGPAEFITARYRRRGGF